MFNNYCKYVFSLVVLGVFSISLNAVSSDDVLEPGEEDFKDSPITDRGNEDSDLVRGVSLGEPLFRGEGCPDGAARALISPDGKTLSLLFDQYETRAGVQSPKRTALDCDIKIPFMVPEGYQVIATRMDYRGFAHAPKKGKSVLKARYVALDLNHRPVSEVVKRRKIFQGPWSDNYTVASRIRINKFLNSCGKSFVLNINTRLVAVSNSKNEEAITSLDTIDQGVVDYHLKWKRCDRTMREERPSRPMPPPPPRHGRR